MLSILLFTVGAARAQEAAQPIQVEADRLEYDSERQMLRATGNVVVTQGADTLRADYADVSRETQVVHAKGHVILQRDTSIWEGEELTYDFARREGDFGSFEAFTDPFYVTAQESKRLSSTVYYLEDATITTCDPGEHGLHMRAKSAQITEGESVSAKNVVFFMGPVPFFYLPYFKKNLTQTNIDVLPGYSSEMGPFLLTAYNYWIGGYYVKGATHLDLRTKRGLGVGQDIIWKHPEGDWQGQFLTYFINDQEPFDNSEDEDLRGNLIDDNRGRVRLSHYQGISDRAYVLAELNYLSDPDILEDFFDHEFRHVSQPENRVSVTHRGDDYTATLLFNKKLNDFYSNVDRLPEVVLDVNRMHIPESPLYYEGQHSIAFLRADFADEVQRDQTVQDDYDAFRMDTFNRILYPTRHFDFLNVIPRVGYRGTYYSKTRETSTVTESVTSVDDLGMTVTNLVTTSVDAEGSSALRNMFEWGFETSFKAFRVIHEDPLWGHYEGLRHVVEPFADYTYVPTPNQKPEDLFQFDAIDRLNRRNDLTLGVRNKLQTKRGGKTVHDLLDSDIYTVYRLDPEPDENDFSAVFFDTEIRPIGWASIDFDGAYDFESSNLDEFNTQMSVYLRDESRVALEYRFRDEARNLVATQLELFPRAKWSFDTYWRYNMDTDELEEHEHFLKTETGCMGIGLGYREVARVGPDDRMVWGQIWLTAFPQSFLSLGR